MQSYQKRMFRDQQFPVGGAFGPGDLINWTLYFQIMPTLPTPILYHFEVMATWKKDKNLENFADKLGELKAIKITFTWYVNITSVP